MTFDSTPAPRQVRYGDFTPTGLPRDLLERASRRLGWAALIYAGTYFMSYFGSTTVSPDSWATLLTHPATPVATGSIALALAIYFLSRFGRLRPEVLLDIGLVFEVVGAIGIAWANVWGSWPEIGQFDLWFQDLRTQAGWVGIPWECVWILLFPLIVPTTLGKTIMASIGAASAGMIVLALSMVFGATAPDVPFGILFSYYLFSTYLCAAIAVVISRVVYRYGRRLAKAQEVGSYRLTELLGRGGMGDVWVAEHQMLARPAAIKLIRPEALGANEAGARVVEERFKREARATAALRSTHTVDLYDFGITDDGAFYYVMEMLDGLDLATLVGRHGPLPAARVVHLLRGVCHSLGEAHGQGMIHRDVKPANIFTCRLGPDLDYVKVLDFGLVKSTGKEAGGATALTQEGSVAGTPAFMAPEMALGDSSMDGRADLYALGCVGYWLLTGQPVFAGDTPVATLLKHVQEEPLPPSRRTEMEVPGDLEAVILSCLAKNPADRPQTAEELDARLAACEMETWTPDSAEEWWNLHGRDYGLSSGASPAT
jgi:tRNA A-37 threonylcarbamoyl transferase component Bud32